MFYVLPVHVLEYFEYTSMYEKSVQYTHTQKYQKIKLHSSFTIIYFHTSSVHMHLSRVNTPDGLYSLGCPYFHCVVPRTTHDLLIVWHEDHRRYHVGVPLQTSKILACFNFPQP